MKYKTYRFITIITGLLFINCFLRESRLDNAVLRASENPEIPDTIINKNLERKDSVQFVQQSECDFLDKKYKKTVYWMRPRTKENKKRVIISQFIIIFQLSDPEMGFARISFYPRNESASNILDSLHLRYQQNLSSFEKIEFPRLISKLASNETIMSIPLTNSHEYAHDSFIALKKTIIF